MSFDGAPQLLPHQVPAFTGNNVIAMAGTAGSDRNLHVRFYTEPVYQEAESLKEGRAIYRDIQFVHIAAPGNKSDLIRQVRLMRDNGIPTDPERFPGQWQAFKNQQEQVQEGTPLEMCKFLAGHRVMELKAARIFTAEQYAELPDSIAGTLGMGVNRERELCRAFLKEDVKHAELSASLAREAALKADMAMMKEQLALLNSRIGDRQPPFPDNSEDQPRAKRKYTKRQPDEEEITP